MAGNARSLRIHGVGMAVTVEGAKVAGGASAWLSHGMVQGTTLQDIPSCCIMAGIAVQPAMHLSGIGEGPNVRHMAVDAQRFIPHIVDMGPVLARMVGQHGHVSVV